MAIIESTISPSSAAFAANRDGMLALIARMRALEERDARRVGRRQGSLSQARPAAAARARGAAARSRRALPRTVVAGGLLFDVPDAAKSVPGGGMIAGIGFVSGVRCMVVASDAGIDAGAMQPMAATRPLRAQELALENKLPYVQLVESAGANLLRYRVEDFIHGGDIFRNLARLSAAGLPVVTVMHGSSTAGGAYQTGLSDYIVMVRGRTRAFLAGPPLLKAATGEIATDEELGGAVMHTSISGLGDYLAEDDRDALAHRARDHGQARMGSPDAVHGRLMHRRATTRRNCSASCRWTTSARSTCAQVIARIVDDSDFLEFGADYGPATVCGHARIEGQAIGIVTNNGPLDLPGANKATHFIQACCQAGRRSSICRTPPATWSARPTKRPA